MSTLFICGAGNLEGVRLARRVNEAEKRWERIVILDDDAAKHGTMLVGQEIVGTFDELGHGDAEQDEVSNMVARSTAGRWAAREKIASFGLRFATLIHPNVDRESVTLLSTDVTAYQNAVLGAHCTLDEGGVVFMGACLGHGASMGRCSVLAPGAIINARVEVGVGVYVGSNASVLPDLEVGDWSTVGACSMVLQNVPSGSMVMGVPGKALQMRKDNPMPHKLRTAGAPDAGANAEKQS